MFVSFSWLSSVQHNGVEKYNYRIVDTDFTHIGIVDRCDPSIEMIMIISVIDTYELKELNVAINIIYALKYYSKEYNTDTQYILDYVANNKKYLQYKDQVEKYLLLL
jgi:hypothetical protein